LFFGAAVGYGRWKAQPVETAGKAIHEMGFHVRGQNSQRVLPSPAPAMEKPEVEIAVDANQLALKKNLELLEQGYRRLVEAANYTATFFRQERIGGELTEGDVSEIKIRHSPFSVYMKWLVGETDKEILFVSGQNDDNLLVRQVGWKARLLPEVSVNPYSPLALRESRHPVTNLGLLHLVETLISNRRRDLNEKLSVKCQMFSNECCYDRDCFRFIVEYNDPLVSKEYRKSDLYIDKKLSLPVEIANYGWPELLGKNWSSEELDDATLVECYGYQDVVLGAQLADLDFDRTNEEYGFGR